MAGRAKTRTYNSPRRQEQAAATRRQILEAAQPLFERQGYATTSVAAIAAGAGVAVKTVYLAFETKSGILRALWNLLLRGDIEEVPVAEREWYREALEEPDPERQLRLNARNSRRAKGRMGSLILVIRAAAPAEPEIDALWKGIESDFHENQGRIAKSLQKKGALRSGLSVRRATDILWTLNHPDVYQLLVGSRGWTPAQYEKWLGDAFCSELLGPRASRKRSA
jgi:AcrR family transcriptional regulator